MLNVVMTFRPPVGEKFLIIRIDEKPVMSRKATPKTRSCLISAGRKLPDMINDEVVASQSFKKVLLVHFLLAKNAWECVCDDN
jgi:hypothetical protein